MKGRGWIGARCSPAIKRRIVIIASILVSIFTSLLPAGVVNAASPTPCHDATISTGLRETNPGEMVTHVFVIANKSEPGGTDAPCRVVWSLATPEGWSVVGSPQGDLALGAGETKEVFATVLVPSAVPAGDYSISFISRGGTVEEGEPSGEEVSVEGVVRVKRTGRLALRGTTETWRVLPGDEIDFSLSLYNQGNTEEDIILSVEAPLSWRITMTPRRFELAPGASQRIDVKATVPTSQFPGTVYLDFETVSRRSGATASHAVRVGVLPAGQSADGPLYLQIPGILRLYAGADPKWGNTSFQGQVVAGGTLPSGLEVGGGLAVSDLSDPLASSGVDLDARNQTWSIQVGSVGENLAKFVNARAKGVGVSYTPRIGADPSARLIVGTREKEGVTAIATQFQRGQFRLNPVALSTIPLDDSVDELRVFSLGGKLGLTSRLSADFDAAVSKRGDGFLLSETPLERALGGGLSLRGSLGSIRFEAAQVGAGYEGIIAPAGTGTRLGDPGTEGAALRANIPIGTSEIRPGIQRFRDAGEPGDDSLIVNNLYVNTVTRLARRHTMTLGAGLTDTQRRTDEPLGESMSGRLGVSFQGGFGSFRYGLGWSERESFRQSSGWRPRRQEYDVGMGIGGLWGRYVSGREHLSGGTEPFSRLELGVDTSIPYTSATLRVAGGQTAEVDRDISNRASIGLEAPWGTETSVGLQVSVNAPGGRDASNPLTSWVKSLFSPLAESWIGLTVAKRFALPVPWVKVKGRIQGAVRLEESGTGVTGGSDEAESSGQALSGIYVRSGIHTVRTDANGHFKFPPFEPGTYEVYLENLPTELTSKLELPIRVTIEAGDEVDLTIPIERAIAIAGSVYLDNDEDGQRTEGESGVAGARLLLYSEENQSREALLEAYTGADGTFRFSDLTPGRYRVEIDPEWLPDRHVLLGSDSAHVEVGPEGATEGEDDVSVVLRALQFPVKVVEKEVRFTYIEDE